MLAEWVRHTAAESVTIYTPDPSVHAFAGFPDSVRVVQVDVPGPFEGLGAALGLLRSIPSGRAVARQIDAGGHDAVLVLPSRLTQSPTVLEHLRTPTVYYAPEAMRSAYEDPNLVFLGDGWKLRVTRAGLNPIEWLRRAVDRRAARSAPYVITHSQFTKDDLQRSYRIDAEVLRLGVDLDAFTPLPAAEVATAERYLLSVGALHPLKGHELVVEAVGRLPHEQRPRLTIVGDRGFTGPALTALAQQRGVELDLRSSIPFPEVVGLMQRAVVVVCAQIREPFGLVPLEAMASGRPVVAVADGGLRESVRDGETGLLVPRDAQALADAVGRLLDDRALAARFGAAGRADVEAHWRWDAYAHEVDRVLREQHAAQRR